MTVVEASTAHAQVLAHIHGEGFDAPWSQAALLSALASPGAFALIAQDDQADDAEPLGFVLMRVGGGEAEVLTIATRPEARRSGVAKNLMAAAAKRAQKDGAQVLFLEVAEDNAPAQALYTALGFFQVGRRERYYTRPNGTRVDALVMSFKFS